MGRRSARELALKILYQYEEGDSDIDGIIKTMFEEKDRNKDVRDFCTRLVMYTVQHLEEIDRSIIHVLENWPYERVSLIDKIILRLGACEILFFDDVPPQVSINEAIEIVKKYGGDNSGKFVNGILDAVKKEYESSCHK